MSEETTTTEAPAKRKRRVLYSRTRATKWRPKQIDKVEEVRKVNGFESWSHALRFIVDCHGEVGRSPLKGARS